MMIRLLLQAFAGCVAAASAARLALLPDVPTAVENGVPGYEVTGWNGVAVPAKTPRAIVESLNREIIAAVSGPHIRQRFQELGVVENTSTPDGMRKRVINEIARWNALIDKAKIPRL
jgi:tripartite-type tricarboxylate transporter receptor subunit TctC